MPKPLLRIAGAVLAAAVAVLAAGCSHNLERVTVPPVAPVDGVQSIAIVGISNFTVDPGLGLLFEQLTASILRESQRYTVIDSATAKAALAGMGATLDQLADPEVARALGQRIGADALIFGSANYYFEDTRVSTPQCFNCNVQGRQPYWTVTHSTVIQSTFQARVVKTDTGAIIWSKVVDGRDTTDRSIYLSWTQSTPPEASLLPRPDRSDVPATREEAVREAARLFTQDLLPQQIWVRREN